MFSVVSGESEMSKVSIIIPTYNVEQYLIECLESIVRQTLKDIEIICVNDGSTDGSLKIIEEYAARDDRIIVITGENAGYGSAMNKGLDRATGEYIGIVEPDDYISFIMYEDLYTIAKERDVDIVKADFYRFTTEKNGDVHFVYNHLSKDDADYNRIICPKDEQKAFRFIMNTWSGIYRRAFIEEYKIRHNETPGASFQDNGFWFQTFCNAKRAFFVKKPYYINRRDNVNSSVNDPRKVYCMDVEYDHIRKLLETAGNWETFKGIYFLKRLHNTFFTIRRISDDVKEEYVNFASKGFKEALGKGEIEEKSLTKDEFNKLKTLANDPRMFYLKYVLIDNPQAVTAKGQEEKVLIEQIDNLLKSGSKEDTNKAFVICFKAANSGSGGAMGRLGRMYRDGKGTGRDMKEAATWMERATDKGVTWAGNELVDILLESDSKDDYVKAYKICSASAEKGDGGAMGRLGRMYRRGKGVKKDLNKATEWMEQAMEKKVSWAEKEFIDIALEGKSKSYYKKAHKVCLASAEKGDGGAMGRIGRMYRDGKGVGKNREKAIHWMQRAADKGVPWAKNELTDILLNGTSPSEYTRAYKTCLIFAEEGDGGAMGRIGRMYRDGKGVKKNLNLAISWMQRAAEKNVPWAIVELEELHEAKNAAGKSSS